MTNNEIHTVPTAEDETLRLWRENRHRKELFKARKEMAHLDRLDQIAKKPIVLRPFLYCWAKIRFSSLYTVFAVCWFIAGLLWGGFLSHIIW